MMMLIVEAIRTALEQLWAHRLRSALTLAGMVLGTMAVIILISLIDAVKVDIFTGLQSLGLQRTMVVRDAPPLTTAGRRRAHSRDPLRAADAIAVQGHPGLIADTAPVAATRRVISRGEQLVRARVTGTTPAYNRVIHREVAAGRLLADLDQHRAGRVAVLGWELAGKLHPSRDLVGRTIRIGNHELLVVGIGAKIGSALASNAFTRAEMDSVTIPLSTYNQLLDADRRISFLVVRIPESAPVKLAERYLRGRLWRLHNRVEDFRIDNLAADMARTEARVRSQIKGWTAVLAAISGISLLVGGIGILSVLQISLVERLPEIGLRKAIGASPGAIFLQLLVEALVLAGIGAAAGITVGALICAALSSSFLTGLPVSRVAISLAVSFAAVIGITSGLYPAVLGSRLSPVDALRA